MCVNKIFLFLPKGSSTSTEEPTMEGIMQACAVMAHKEKKSEERSKDKKPNKVQ